MHILSKIVHLRSRRNQRLMPLMKYFAKAKHEIKSPIAAAISFERSEDFILQSNISPTRESGFSFFKKKTLSFDKIFSVREVVKV